jgi:hypothetical protein
MGRVSATHLVLGRSRVLELAADYSVHSPIVVDGVEAGRAPDVVGVVGISAALLHVDYITTATGVDYVFVWTSDIRYGVRSPVAVDGVVDPRADEGVAVIVALTGGRVADRGGHSVSQPAGKEYRHHNGCEQCNGSPRVVPLSEGRRFHVR